MEGRYDKRADPEAISAVCPVIDAMATEQMQMANLVAVT
jgi:hypothetical protein